MYVNLSLKWIACELKIITKRKRLFLKHTKFPFPQNVRLEVSFGMQLYLNYSPADFQWMNVNPWMLLFYYFFDSTHTERKAAAVSCAVQSKK